MLISFVFCQVRLLLVEVPLDEIPAHLLVCPFSSPTLGPFEPFPGKDMRQTVVFQVQLKHVL